MADDIILSKAGIIERCMARVREEYAGDEDNLFDNITRQDAIILNLQRACEAAIDLAMHLVRTHRLGVPQETRQAFEFLREAKLIDPPLSDRMERMVDFRNIAVRDYRKLDLAVVKNIIQKHLQDFLDFATAALRLTS